MRKLFIVAAIAALPSCKWTDFDDLSNTTWVHSQTKPAGDSASDYAVALANATVDATGGKLAVLGNDKPSYSTLVFQPGGKTDLGPNPQALGVHFIVSLGEAPILLSDTAANKVAIVAAAIDAGNVAVVSGPPDSVSDQTFQALAPQAATFANGNVVIVAGDPVPANGTNIYTVVASPPKKCAVVDDTNMPLTATAIASDGTMLWVWAKSGSFFGYNLATVSAGCLVAKAPDTAIVATSFMAGTGARIHIVGSPSGANEYAVLAAHGDHLTTGQVIVINLKGTPALVGVPLMVDGIRSSAVGVLGAPATGSTYVVLGLPDRVVGSVKGGQVEVHEIVPTTGELKPTPTALLNDAQPESNELFGRAVAIMKFNGNNILTVAASNEIFAYYETLQYPDTRM